jgi:hypothetical protein
MEWLFLTCHNHWIVCRLVRDDDHPFLAYSPKITIENSSEPFRAFLGAILSVTKGVSVESSAFNPEMEFDHTVGEEDEGPQPEDDVSNSYSMCPGTRAGRQNTESGLMVCLFLNHILSFPVFIYAQITASSPSSPESFQVWVNLHTLSNNTLALPQCARNGKRLWLTRFVGFGSTGNVWQCRFDGSENYFAVKIVEVLSRSDADRRRRLCNEFNVYLTLEEAYQSGQLSNRIAPHCYGAFEGDGVDALILDFHDGVLNTWEELSTSER